MSKTIKQIIITAVLLVVLVVMSINNLKGGSRRKQKVTQDVAGALSPSLRAISADKKTINLQKERAETLTWDRDPFQYVEAEADKSYRTGTLMLKGISLGEDKAGFAFINNEIVRVGDSIGGHEIIQIQRDKVLLTRDNQSFYLTLPEK